MCCAFRRIYLNNYREKFIKSPQLLVKPYQPKGAHGAPCMENTFTDGFTTATNIITFNPQCVINFCVYDHRDISRDQMRDLERLFVKTRFVYCVCTREKVFFDKETSRILNRDDPDYHP
ncbi:hypothetical protein DMN91_005479 [Ooceraea biroi]|uniref:Uncharacterized protein n=1 Tax=Ooceraea biroi TaxID=2015173 RepID=A0A3L8DLB2_OOCBI|nr:hypothetical protein DMN91_005479 [Ooceraea biroi]